MSERRVLNTFIRDASSALHEGARHLDEAHEYMERYPFLQEANPELMRYLETCGREIRKEADKLWDIEVLS